MDAKRKEILLALQEHFQEHNAARYLSELLNNGIISGIEHETIFIAIVPLMQLIGQLKDAFIDAVRQETASIPMAAGETAIHALRNIEAPLWINDERRRLIDGFDFGRAHQKFLVTPKSDPKKTIVALPGVNLDEELEYVPNHLCTAEYIFFMLLRMFRKQYEAERGKTHFRAVSLYSVDAFRKGK